MIGTALALTCAFLAVGMSPDETAPPNVRLAPVRCLDLPDAAVRTPLRVELGKRLAVEETEGGRDFLLVSIACDGPDATLLAVHQSGGLPFRRLVPLATVAPEARAREVALAAVELIRIADRVEEVPPPPVVESPVPPPVATGPTFTFGASTFIFGGYFSGGNFLNAEGATIRLGLELGVERPPSPRWKWGVAYEFIGAGTGSEFDAMNGLLALLQYRGGHVVPEIGLGARVGWISKELPTDMSTLDLTGGPMASASLQVRMLPGFSADLTTEAGYDLRGYGLWLLPRLGLTVRY